MSSAGIGLQTTVPVDSYLLETKRLCDKIAEVKADNTQALFGDLHQMATLYYQGALTQASRSFLAAQIFAGLGTIVIVAVALWMMKTKEFSRFGVLSGGVIQAISALNFYM